MTVVSSGEVSDTTMHTYNVRGWQTSIENDSWSSVMRYQNPEFEESDASFTGNISEWEWSRGNTTYAYSLEYDALSRIKESRLFKNGNPVDALSESGISYDSNGNILSLTRTGEDGSAVNDLSYHYDGNRLTSLSDGDVQSQNYTYDADGNMTFDGRTGMSLTWNDLGLVEKVSLNDTDLVNYSYLADGTKVSALDGDGDGLLYLGSLIYKKTGNSIELESAGFAGGRFVARTPAPGVSAMVPMIHVTDHLGSVRAVVDGVSGEVIETNDYYPFGSRWDVATSLKDDSNRFRYNSKEEQFNLGTPYIDYGARQYDPVLGRWFAQDPLSEKYYSISPYAFCAGNPVKYLDPDGEAIGTLSGAILGAIFGGVNAYIKGENVKKGIVSGSISGAITGAAVDLAIASGGTLGIVFGASVIGGAVGGVTGDVIGSAVVNENITISDVIEAGYNGAVAGAVSGTISVGSHAISTTAKGAIKGLFSGVDDVKSSLPSASDEIVSEISQKVAQSEQQAMKNVDRSQLYFEIFTEAVYFLSNQTNEKEE